MKVIKKARPKKMAKIKPWVLRIVCPSCGSTLSYGSDDIVHGTCEDSDGAYFDINYVVCPVCKCRIGLNDSGEVHTNHWPIKW